MRTAAFMLVAGLVLIGLGLWCLRSGQVIDRWGIPLGTGTPFYWIVVAALFLCGALNLYAGARLFLSGH